MKTQLQQTITRGPLSLAALRPVQVAITATIRAARAPGLLAALVVAAGAFAGPAPNVRIDPATPQEVMIGSTYTFTLWFHNNGDTPGYGPYIDLHIDAGGADLNQTAGTCAPGCDGLSIVDVTRFGDLVFDSGATAPCSAAPNAITHPFAASFAGKPILQTFTTCTGGQLAVIKLKTGVVYPTEPEFPVQVTVKISELADPDVPLMIYARGGFQYGATPADDSIPDPPVVQLWTDATDTPCVPPSWCSWCGPWYGFASVALTPTVLKVSKVYFGPENETATGPNNLQYYGLIVDVASGQTIKNLQLQDLFPNNMVFANAVQVWPHPVPGAPAPDFYTGTPLTGFSANSPMLGGACSSGADYEITQTPSPAGQPTLAPDNKLEIKLCHDVVGGPGTELAVVFAFYIPETNALGQLILDPATCAVAHSTNDLRVEGDWWPADCRDPAPTQIVSDEKPADHVLDDKCLAIQKSWQPVVPLKPVIPGDQLKYTLNFQGSDYRTLNNLVVLDYLSDGQVLNPGSATLTVSDQFGATPASGTVAFSGADLIIEANQPAICRDGTSFSSGSATKLTFKVSDLMISQNLNARHGAGILTGGEATGTPANVGARGQITFTVTIQDTFTHPQGPRPGDPFVDKFDFLDNCVTMDGNVLDNTTLIPNGCVAEDQSQAHVPIAGTQLTKSVFAITRPGVGLIIGSDPRLNPPVLVSPGDQVTFRLQMNLPSSDGENLIIHDWFPGPIMRVDDPDADGTAGEIWNSFSGVLSWSGLPPGVGAASAGPSDLFNQDTANGWSRLVVMNAYYPASNPGENTLEFLYGSFNDPNNRPRLNDLLFTLTVGSAPYADGYKIANVATECEDNTFSQGTNICTWSSAELILGEPNLKLSKGVVAVDELTSPNAVFTPTLGNPLFTSPNIGGCPRFSGIVSAANLTSDVSGLNPGTIVTFAVVVENVGSGPLGAFDVAISDVLPPCFIATNNICVSYGDSALPVPGYSGDLFNTPLELNDPGTGLGALGPLGGAPGANVAVITFDALYDPQPGAACCTNHAELTRYSNVEGGANFITAGLFAQAVDEARACESNCVPQIICATNKTILCGDPVVWDSPVITNSCCGTNVTITVLSTVTSNNCPRTMTRTWRIQDTCGYSNLCQQTITLLDFTAPVISRCATNRTLTPGTNCLATIPDMRGQLIATDNCGPRTITQSPLLIQVGPGTYPVVFTVCDTCTNCVTCTNYVTVLTCPTNCCDTCTTNDYVSYSVVVQPGFNFLANVLCQGTNKSADLNTLLPLAPEGAMVTKWDYAAQGYGDNASYISIFGWDPNLTIKLGEGFSLYNPGEAYTNTFTGCVPDCPRPCGPTNGCQLVGAYSTGMTTWDDLYRCPPECGTKVSVWNAANQAWAVHTYLNGAWTPSVPAWPLGHAVMVCVQSDPRCCTNNLVFNGSFETTSPVVAPNDGNNSLDAATGVPGWTTAAGEYLEVWANIFRDIPASQGVNQLEINAQSADQTVSQTVTGLRTNCPANFCFDYTGRFGLAGGSPNNDFTVTLNGGAAMSVTLNPAEFATGGWLRFCTNFVPTSSTITIAFRGHPHYSDGTQNTEGGAHIDNVTVTQCCDTNPCTTPTTLTCASNKTVECGSSWSFDPPQVNSPCCGTNWSLTISGTTTNGTRCAQVITRTWVLTDCLNHTETCHQIVTVVDTTPPVVTCPAAKTVECGAGWTFDAPTAYDACCGTNVTLIEFGTTTNLGLCISTFTRAWQATDCCSNSVTCSQTVTLRDTTPPVFSGSGLGPNLVPNASFESYTTCPYDYSQVNFLANWYSPTPTTPDFFHACGSGPAGVPANFPGSQSPHDGSGYAGFFAFITGYREYVEAQLTAPLQAGQTYEVSFYVSLADTCGDAVDNLGAYLSAGSLTGSGTGNFPVTPQVRHLTGYLSSKTDWMLVKGSFTAAGGEDHITIGSFYSDASTVLSPVGGGFSYYVYYYLDSVSVSVVTSGCGGNRIVECGAPWAFERPTAIDACCTNLPVTLISSNLVSILPPCQYVFEGVWRALDCCSNSATCTQTVTVVDTTPPIVAFCPTNVIACRGTNGCGVMPDATGQVLANDACGTVTVTQSIPVGAQVCSNTLVVFTITDACSNATVCVAPVFVEPCCYQRPPGMKLWLTFGESVGVTCLNSMGGNNGIRYEGAVTANNANGPTRLAGEYVNRSLCFDGVNDTVIVNSYGGAGGINAGGLDFSIDLWVKWDGTTNTLCLLDKRTANADHTVVIGYALFLRAGAPRLFLGDGNPGSGGAYQLPLSHTLPVNQWTHLAVTVDRDGGSAGIQFYLDGVPAGPTFNPSGQQQSLSTSAPLWIGYSPTALTDTHFRGCLDEIEFFRRVLTPAEVLGIYQAQTKGKCRPFCTVPAVLSLCTNSVTIAATVCNPGAFGQTFTVSFNGLTALQCGLPGAVNWPSSPNPFSPSATSVYVGPNSCVTLPVTITRPPALYGSPLLGTQKVACYRMVVANAAGEKFSCEGRLVDGAWNCPIAVGGGSGTNIVLKGTNGTVITFPLTNPTNATVTLHPTVRVLWMRDGLMVAETNVVSLNGLPPGTPWTTTVVLPPGGASNLLVSVNLIEAEPTTPFYVVFESDIGEGGAMEAIASATVLNENPATVGPVLNMNLSGSLPVISWDLVNGPFVLESSPSLGGTNWAPVLELVVPLPDGSEGVILQGTNSSRFFRGRQ